MPVTSTDIANQAVNLMGDNQPPVTGVAPNFDDSRAGKALRYIYTPTVQTVGRQFEWDMSRRTVALTPSGNAAPFPYAFEYLYPTNGIEVWQLFPPQAAVPDLNNPLPTNWTVGNAVVTAQQRKVIWTDLDDALCVYNNNPNEDTWDPLFREAVVRLLASNLAIALAGKPDTSEVLLKSGAAFEQLAEQRDS